MVDTPDQDSESIAFKVRGESDLTGMLDIQARRNNHTYQTVFNLKVAGFTTHAFNDDYSELLTKYVSYDGEIIHSFTSYRDGSLKV